MSHARERERRRWYLERFLERIGWEGATEDASPEGAGTDHVVEEPDRRIGVRIFELLSPPDDPPTRESVRAFRSAVLEAAGKEWERRPDHPDLEVWVEFSEYEQTTALRHREELGRKLCDVVASKMPDPGGFARIVAGRGETEAPFPLVAPAVTVARLPTYEGTSWYATSGAGERELDVERIREAVEEMSSRDPTALEGTDERWLVGVVESFRHPSMEGLPSESGTEGQGSAFDRFWLFDPATNELRELES